MRPLTLRVEGLRSYRAAQEVSFEGRDMVAIVGDTGAGKSSLLEAITFALYGASTWSKQPGDLIGDRAETMKVELTFRADGQTWRATRTMSRGSRPSTHRLENLDTGERFDGVRDIAAVVERLLGLDHDGFLRTVLLPQGRFAQLLEATPNERQKILRNIFRVDELDKVRDRSRDLHARLEPKLATLRFARGRLADDPRAAAEAAARRAEGADAEVKRLEAAATEVDLARRAADEARREAQALDRLVAAVDLAAAEAAVRRIGEVAGADADLGAAVAAAEAALTEAEAAVGTAEAALAAATEAGDTEPALRAARQALDALPGLMADLAGLLDDRAAADAQAREADARARVVAAAREELAEAEAAAERLDEAIDAARGRLDRLQRRVGDAATARRRLGEARAQLAAAEDRRREAATAATAAEAEAVAAKERCAAAEVALADARRADAAAHAAAGLTAGDPCPVCERTLPSGFHAPTVPALAAAEQAAEHARTHAEGMTAAASRAAAHHEAAVQAVATADELVAARTTAWEAALAALVAEAGHDVEVPRPADDTNDTDDTDGSDTDAGAAFAAVLAPVAEELAERQSERAALADRLAALRTDVAASDARAAALREQVAKARAAHARAVASGRRRLDQVLAALDPVPAWRPELPDLAAVLDLADPDRPAPTPAGADDAGADDAAAAADGDAAAGDVAVDDDGQLAIDWGGASGPSAGADADADADGVPAPIAEVPEVDVAEAVERIDRRLGELQALAAEVRAAVARRDEARAALDAAARARRDAAAATADHYRRLDQLGARVNDAAARVGAEPTPEPPAGRAEPEGLAAGAAWGEALLDRTRAVVAAVEAAAGAHRSTAADHDATAARALEQVGAADADALHAAQATAIAMAATARDEHERALAEVPLADELDRRITAATRFLDAVGLVRDRLANSAFIGEVMKRRHAELLGVASRILGEVTGGRYGFSVDFAIVDLQSNQERPTKTLSGGESFLASLALALAMVEIAARGGGRLDALFLDEGFGSLDRASLDAAIDALEARAGQGRLVAVISHVAGLAERIEDVLEVRAGPGGSVATWQTAADKEATFVGAALTALDSLDSLDAG